MASQVSPLFLSLDKKNSWLGQLLKEAAVFHSAPVEREFHWRRLSAEDVASEETGPERGLCHIRASEPVKSFFFNPRETVATLPEKLVPGPVEKRILFGAKQCDLVPLRVHRKMFLEQEYKDEFYAERRKNTLVIAADCPEPADACFCNLVGGRPYAARDDADEADVSLSVVEGGWILEALTPEGERLVSLAGAVTATEAQLTARQASRKKAEEALARINPKPFAPDTPERIWKRNTDKAFWDKQSEGCVECYGCLMTCPTCYCFLLYDKAKGQGAMERTKVWDACYEAAYARVGGGANPRAEFYKRFFNRFYCKFSHFKTWQGMYACSGCGRCTKTCMGKIDVRKVVLDV